MIVDLPEKLYYSIGEVAKAFKVKTSLLRFWENEFDSIKPKKKQTGTRKYTQKDIESIQLIYHLVKEKGMTLAGAKSRLKEKKGMIYEKNLIVKLEKIKSELKLILNHL
jgi:DNA-binding transcriptional MerR regulator